MRCALARLRQDRGAMALSFAEVLVVVPLLLAAGVAGTAFMFGAIKGEARSTNRTVLAKNAQRSLDRIVREMRSASGIDYLTPDVTLSSTNSAAGNCEAAGVPAYCTGETNRVVARDAYLAAAGSKRRDILFKCDYASFATRCYEQYALGDANIGLGDPPGSAAGLHCKLLFPVGGLSGSSNAVSNGCNVAGNGSLTDAANDTVRPSPFRSNDWAWLNVALGVFQFQRNGTPVQPTPTDPVDYLEIHPTLCMRTPYCNVPGQTRPLRFNAGVTPRNRVAGGQ